jgi:hypothetical protein
MMRLILVVFFLFVSSFSKAQFAPQVGIWGTTAIHKSNTAFKAWASECTIHRGYMDIADKPLGKTILGDSANVFGIADGAVVSLGDSGVAVVKFAQSIYDGVGADFAVFENGFQNPANPEEAFLELAFVEVSSDGEHYFRFPATSNTNSSIQVRGSGDYMNARYIHNLAGKYIAQNGTPFDLSDLKGTVGLDLNNITHIKIVDVVGSVKSNQSFDRNGQKINDPYPTPFSTGGFDLDAVGAINIKSAGMSNISLAQTNIFPNPAREKVFVTFNLANSEASELVVTDLSGKILLEQTIQQQNELNVENLALGLYLISIRTTNGYQCVGKFSKM